MTDEELRGLFDTLSGELRRLAEENAAAHQETRSVLGAEIDETRSTLRGENAAAHEETRRHFDIMVESVRHDTQLVAENLLDMKAVLVRLAEKLDQTSTDLQAMIKFSHSELDKRLRALEATH